MQLSLHADYSFRVLVYLATHRDRLVTTQEISSAYGISKHHLVRVIQTLAEHRLVNVQPGRSGGASLARDPGQIRLDEIVRVAEPNFRLVECFDRETNTCPIAPFCALKKVLNDSLSAFLSTLSRYTLEDVIRNSGQRKLEGVFATFAGWTP